MDNKSAPVKRRTLYPLVLNSAANLLYTPAEMILNRQQQGNIEANIDK
jgi:hypothetical protein